jgi:hypothetical protein
VPLFAASLFAVAMAALSAATVVMLLPIIVGMN